ncbi:MAG: leucine-rich repeat protein, partial [Clostridia bacterium]|nr:leucine-rich repeat protein [Clostridia bacterium]
IGEWTFSDCSNLTSITIPTSVTIIGDGAFSGCSNLTNITIPSSVKNIGDYAFYDCSNLSSITIPNSVTSIGDYTFEYCPNLTSITIPDSVTNIGDYAFYGCDSLTSIIVENNNDYYSSVDGVLFNKEMTELICFPAGKATSYAIPDSVTSIVDWAFGGCDGLTSITIPNSVTSIGEWTFSDCSNLTSITIPTSVTSIGIRAFSFCSSLTNITIPNSVTSIREGAFEFCSSLTSITIPNHVTSISDGAFYNCSGLTSITIPDSVTSIGNSAFKYCDNLTIYGYSGSYAETFANENDIPFVSLETSPSLLLNQLISVNYLAFADLAYSKTYKEGQTISSMLASKWDKYWDNTNITYKELYKNIADWTVDSFHSDSNTGFAAYVFKNSHNQYLISYRGSSKLTAKSFLSDPDWLPNDISMILGYEGEQVSQAISLYDTIAKKADVSNIAVTGHSLGGALADIVSAYSGCYGETFNSAPFLDIAYWYFPKEMSKTFAGIETWNFVDHVNKDDRKVGNWFAEEVKPKIVYKHVSHNNNSSHALSSLIKKNNSGIIMLSEPTSIRFKNSVTEQPSILSSFSVIFGTEKSDTITKFNIMGHDLALYGGDGSDKMYTDIFDDYLVGGKGSDTLDGNRGDDTYIYNKGDGVDTIYDINGHDKLYLYGFSNNDSIILDSESNNNFVLIKHNNNTIIKVNKSRGLGGGSFNVIVNDNSFNIVDHMKEKKFTKRYVIACPVDIEILDENKNVVYTVKDAETGAYYTDYGNFYIYEEENGEYGKTIDLIEGYSIRIVGIDDGTMDVSVQYEENGVISKPFATENVPVSLGMSANIVSNESQEFELSLDYDDDKNADSTIKLLNYSTVKFNSNKGNCNISSIKAYEGKLEELPEATREGYTFKGWYTSKYNGTKITSDTIFEEDTTIYAQWICGEKCVSSKFTDVDTKQWYHESIDYAVENGLMNGVSDTRFDINGTTTRSQLVTLLWRLEGQPEVDYEINFRDVESDSWYTEAIRWAASKSIVNGYSDTEFGTNDAITREQLAALLYRYEQYKGGGFKGQWDYTLNFADLKYMSDWAYEAMSWCNMKGLINGKGDNLLDPQGKAIRCEAAALLMRYIEMER